MPSPMLDESTAFTMREVDCAGGGRLVDVGKACGISEPHWSFLKATPRRHLMKQ